jgi:hypothetical protein
VGFVVDKAELGQVFFEYFGCPCQVFHRPLHTHHHPSSGSGTIGQIVADVPSGLSLTPPQETNYQNMFTCMYHSSQRVLHVLILFSLLLVSYEKQINRNTFETPHYIVSFIPSLNSSLLGRNILFERIFFPQ